MNIYNKVFRLILSREGKKRGKHFFMGRHIFIGQLFEALLKFKFDLPLIIDFNGQRKLQY